MPALLLNRWAQLGALALISAITLFVAVQRGNAWKASSERWESAHKAQEAAMAATAQAAEAKAISARLQAENRYTELARSNDVTLEETRASVGAAAARYAAANGLRSEALGSARSGTSATPNGGDPGQPIPAGGETEFLAISRNDFDILVENTVRLEAAHSWAKTLNLAPPVPEFGGTN